MSVQWYPGHMAKATRLMKEELKKVDVVVVLGDARAVNRSINRDFFEIIKNKRRILVFNKSDMADEAINTAWQRRFQEQNETVFFIDCLNKKGITELVSNIKLYKKSIRYDRAVHVMIVGIPNVGKSMLINTLAKRNAAHAANRPGVTRANQWIKVGMDFYLLDTPGVLPPKFDTNEDGYALAAIGSIKDAIVDKDELALFILNFLKRQYPLMLAERYKLDSTDCDDVSLMEQIAEKRGFKNKGGVYDYERTAFTILDEFRNGKIGRISFDLPIDAE